MQANQQQTSIKKLCKTAFDLFMNGKQSQLKSTLHQISQLKKQTQPNSHPTKSHSQSQQKSSKFQYQLNFQQQDQKQKPNLKNKQKQPIKPRMISKRKFDYCQICPDNQQLKLLSASNYVYLAMPKLKTFRKYNHFIIAPVDHIQTKIGADQGIIQEMKNYQKCLIQMFDKFGLHAIFLQQFYKDNSHIYLQCIGIPLKKAYDLPFFFKQALENVQGFWTTHKKIIQIRKQKGGIEKQIPKQMKYFYIDFGLGYGYAHVIEDQKFWDKRFCYEIVAAALGLESYQVKTTEQYGQQQLDLKTKQFNNMWKQFDWTVMIDGQKQN